MNKARSQTSYNGEPLLVRERTRFENTQVNDEAQQSEQDEMSDLVAVRKIIHPAEITHMPRIGEEDDQNNEQPEENRPAFHKRLNMPTQCCCVHTIDYASACAPACRAFHASHTAGRSDTTTMPITTMEK